MDKRTFICIGCPMGCMLTAEIGSDNIIIKGNACKIGNDYGIKECTSPCRVITTSVKIVADGNEKMISLKTDKDVPKDKIFDCIKEIKKLELCENLNIGDIVIENILGLGSNIIVTRA